MDRLFYYYYVGIYRSIIIHNTSDTKYIPTEGVKVIFNIMTIFKNSQNCYFQNNQCYTYY